MSRTPPDLGDPPVKLVIVGGSSEPAAVREVYSRLRGPIDQFYNAAHQNALAGVAPDHYQQRQIPEGHLRYTRVAGQETMYVTLAAGSKPKPREKPVSKENPWDWIILEVVAFGMSNNGSGAPYRLTTSALRVSPAPDPATLGILENPVTSESSKEDGLEPPLLAFAGNPATAHLPPSTECINALRVDLREVYGTGETLRVDLESFLTGGAGTVLAAYKSVQASPFNVRLGARRSTVTTNVFLGVAEYDAATGDPIVSAESFWPYATSATGYNYVPAPGLSGTVPTVSAEPYDPGTFPLTSVLRVTVATAPTAPVRSTNAGPSYFYVDGLELWEESGLPKQFVTHQIISNNYRESGGVVYQDIYDRRVTTTVTQPTEESTTGNVYYSRDLEFYWVAGWGEPPDERAYFQQGARTYFQWVQSAAEPLYFGTARIEGYTAVTDNAGAFIPVGSLLVDRHQHTVRMESPD